jgi:hypothetical protein
MSIPPSVTSTITKLDKAWQLPPNIWTFITFNWTINYHQLFNQRTSQITKYQRKILESQIPRLSPRCLLRMRTPLATLLPICKQHNLSLPKQWVRTRNPRPSHYIYSFILTSAFVSILVWATLLTCSVPTTALDPTQTTLPAQAKTSQEQEMRMRGGDRGGMCPGRFCFIIPCPFPCDFCII